jgi:hexosaminidase
VEVGLRRLITITALLLAPAGLGAQALIPSPREVTEHPGQLVWRDSVVIGLAPASPRLREIAGELEATLREAGITARITDGIALARGIALRSGGPGSDESYRMTIDSTGILIDAPTDAGALWGVQTLRQLIGTQSDTIRLGASTIHDAPRYSWRGSMLDVGRHLFPVDHILKHLEWMSRFKLNVFHWHLTEDQGWRIEIDALPRLTEIGAWRTAPRGDALRRPSDPGATGSRPSAAYGGFYSKSDIRRVVERARVLGITVVPEIEMPGHARAALAAYPHLGCTGDTLPVPSTWGVFADVLCPGKESTFTFIETVLGEVLELFPSKYIHIGGDEVPKDRWRVCASCQEIIRRENLGDEHGLQRWMIARVGRWLAAHDRKLIGWDEIMDGGLPEGATVQAWQGSERITAAITAGADVIASPQEWVYLNRQANALTLDRVVRFDPAASIGSGSGRLLGGEAPLWTEHVTSGTNAELMWWPRLMGFAEAMWSGPADSSFAVQAQAMLAALERGGIASGRVRARWPLIDFAFSFEGHQPFTVRPQSDQMFQMQVRVVSGADTGRLQDARTPFHLEHGEFHLSGEYRGESIGEPRSITMVRHFGVSRLVRLATPTDARYPGTGAQTLADGARGQTFNDGLWNGWWGPDLDATFDLDAVRPVTVVALSLLENVNSWIVYPDTLELFRSSDGDRWELVHRKILDRPVVQDASSRELFPFDLPADFRARWLRVVAKGGKRLPAWHSAAGQPAWIFADEIVIEAERGYPGPAQ